jgi:hypothetical protein
MHFHRDTLNNKLRSSNTVEKRAKSEEEPTVTRMMERVKK